MADIEKVIATAQAEVGYLEKASNSQLDDKTANAGNNNYTKYWRDLDPAYQEQAWCQCFLNWCFWKTFGQDAGKILCGIPTCASPYYTPTCAAQFKIAGRWFTSKPQAGDVIYFKNTERIHHVGLVYKVSATYVYTIEGNTSSGNSVIANGGAVCMKSYLLTNTAIAGYGRPIYINTTDEPGWVKMDDGRWQYRQADGQLKKEGWLLIQNYWYLFRDYYMLTGIQKYVNTQTQEEELYYLNETKNGLEGVMLTTNSRGALVAVEVD